MSDGRRIDYHPLSSNEEQIRTLILQAGKVSEPIQCSLRIVSLVEEPSCDALSYVWGDASVTKPIQVEGVHFHATANLERALRHLRDANHDLTLWVDAVCINQKDIEEKSKQVAMMGKIYQQCSQVRIWLGCDETKCGLKQSLSGVDIMLNDRVEEGDPFKIVRSLAKDEHVSDWDCFRKDAGGLIYDTNAAFEASWLGFRTIAKSTWWTRMWTVQEVVLPKAGILTYDTSSVFLDSITSCGVNYYKHVWGCCRTIAGVLPRPISVELDEFCTIFFSLDRDRNSLLEDEYFDIQQQHIAYSFRQCQNPRDKVYGLLAIVGDISDLDLWLTPDYSRLESEVFYDATFAMLHRDVSSLKCLTGAQYGPDSKKWASWVRDFGTTMTQGQSDVESNRLMIYDLFNASVGRKSRWESFMAWPPAADEKPHQVGLGLMGKCVGTVAMICEKNHCGDSAESDEQQRKVFSSWMKASGVDFDRHSNERQCSNDILRFWRTILGGVMSAGQDNTEYSDWRRFTAEALNWYDSFALWIQTGEPTKTFALDRTLLIATDARCYFRTDDGGQGLCHPSVKVGDQVWVLHGSKVPFILRRAVLSDEEQAELRPRDAYGVGEDDVFGLNPDFVDTRTPYEHYNLIGDCYLDGFMDGEAADGVESVVLV